MPMRFMFSQAGGTPARRPALSGAALLVTALVAMQPAPADAQATGGTKSAAGYGIDRIEARLYHHGSGKFSRVIDERMALHNIVIGEGDAGEASEATFVTVLVSGTQLENAMSHVLLEVTQVDGNKRKSILQQRAPVGFLKEGQKQSRVGFWLYQVTCGTFQITARVGNQRFKEPRGLHPAEYGKPVTQTLNYQCGE